MVIPDDRLTGLLCVGIHPKGHEVTKVSPPGLLKPSKHVVR
jgi:hypothetical protein